MGKVHRHSDGSGRPDGITAVEWEQRVNLAAFYRVLAGFGWDDLVFTHVSARVSDAPDYYLLNPYGSLFEEITASSLIKVNLTSGRADRSDKLINPAGVTIHGAVLAARPDVQCVVHLHTPSGVAVSAQEDGLLPITQTALWPYSSLAYHEYEGLALDSDEQVRLARDLGDKTFMILRNHGTLAVGGSIPDAFLAIYEFERACEAQVLALAGGARLRHVPESIVAGIQAQEAESTDGLGGQLAWPALLRRLDRQDPSFRH